MHISLTPEQEARVKAKVKNGAYNNVSEVIQDALQFMNTHKAWIRDTQRAEKRDAKQAATKINSEENKKFESAFNNLFTDL